MKKSSSTKYIRDIIYKENKEQKEKKEYLEKMEKKERKERKEKKNESKHKEKRILYIHGSDHIEDNDIIITSIINYNDIIPENYVLPSQKNAEKLKMEINELRDIMKKEIKELEGLPIFKNPTELAFTSGESHRVIYEKRVEYRNKIIALQKRKEKPSVFLCKSFKCKQLVLDGNGILLQVLYNKCKECHKTYCKKCCVEKSDGFYCNNCMLTIGFC